MAGLPGAGKTEISKRLIQESNISFVRIDMDELAEKLPNYRPEHADRFRLPATTLLNELFSFSIKHHLDIMIDGTFSSPNAIKNIERLLRRGYSIKIIYVYQHPKIAWEFTKAREKVEHRAIEFDGFLRSYGNTIQNIKSITQFNDPKVNLDLVIKRPNNQIGVWYEKISPYNLDSLVNIEYNIDKLKKIILQ